jgi:peptidoglycan/xylan/chitin deacetylase (PgdA/CDA1 family)
MNRTHAALRPLLVAGVAASALALALLVLAGPRDGADAIAAAAPAGRAPVPILVYHALRTAPAGARLPSIYVRPAEFSAQVRALRRGGYSAVTLQRVWDAWHGRATLPRRPVVLSFDDGYTSHVRIALPVLRRERWVGVLNLALDWVDDIGGDGAVQQLIDAGWEIDGHSRTHPDLTQVPSAQLADETAGARAGLQERFGVSANFFAYPGGRFDPRVVAAVKDAGYLAATTVKRGFATPSAPYALARIQVSRGTSGDALLRRLRALRLR